jgi:hypothetical protein
MSLLPSDDADTGKPLEIGPRRFAGCYILSSGNVGMRAHMRTLRAETATSLAADCFMNNFCLSLDRRLPQSYKPALCTSTTSERASGSSVLPLLFPK